MQLGHDPTINLLPRDGTVLYHGPIMDHSSAWTHYDDLLANIPWRQDETVLFGKRITTARKVAWYGDAEFSYTYSGTTKTALPWTAQLRTLKALVEQRTANTYNSCLLNFYHSGNEGMGWHSDDEKSLAHHAPIASLSFGAGRKFRLKHKHLPLNISILLEHGSLLVMKDATQSFWLHSLPKSTRIAAPRVNLTFRTIEI